MWYCCGKFCCHYWLSDFAGRQRKEQIIKMNDIETSNMINFFIVK